MKFFNKTKGAISIFLVIILVPMMTVSSLFVDAGKVKLARGVAESAGDLTLNTALTDYDTMLKDMYGLFATAQDTEELFGKLEDYYRTCITSSGVSAEDADGYVDQIMAQLGLVSESDDTSDVLNMELVDFNVSKRSDATLANPTIIKKQIVDFMKYRAPVNTGLSFISSLQSFSTLDKQTELVDKRQSYYEEQESVMRSAQEAWKYINKYNQSGFVQNDNYFTTMKSNFSNYSDEYNEIAEKIIKDLYDTQSYDTFSPSSYTIVSEEIEVGDSKETVPVFYLNRNKTSKKQLYTELTAYSESKPATADNVKTALTQYYSAYNAVNTAQEKLLEYNDNTYGLQYLVQTNRQNLYNNWVTAMVKLYEKYNTLRHTVAYAGETESGASVMTVKAKICGSNSENAYTEKYSDMMNKFDSLAAVFNTQLSNYNSKLQSYANGIGNSTSTSNTKQSITSLYNEVAGYRKTISDAKSNLETAVLHLNAVYNGVKAGGTLENKQAEWKGVADDEDLKNTSMAKQDLAEINSLSTYLDPDDVQALINRLNNIIGHLEDLLGQIDSYTFFGTKIVEISDYTTLVNLLKNKIGDSNLKNVPTGKTELQNKVNTWLDGKFVVGEAVDVSWENQSNTQANLIKDKPNFYSYLYTHFNEGSVSTSTVEKTEDKENGENLYNSIKDKSSSSANNEASGTDSGSISNDNELVNQAGKPSDNAGNDAKTAAAEVKTDDSAVSDTSKSLSSMFSSLSAAVVDMGTDLRDKLYIADYILSMFSYDTIEKEFAVKNPGEEVQLQTLTLVPINAENNFAYGKEVEYIIYGGTNASNLTKAYGSIFGIRFGFNLIYAFMDSSIRDTAFAIATPISAATLGVIPVPLIQAAIIIGIACCESAIDLNDIRNGEEVPLFKNRESWHCSVNGLINAAKGTVSSVIEEGTNIVIDKGVGKLSEILDMTDEELNQYIEDGAAELTGYVGSAFDTLITRHANMAIQKLTTLCTNAIEENMINPNEDKMVQYVSDGLDAWLEEEAVGVNVSSDIGFIVKKEAVNIIKDQFIGRMIEALQSVSSNVTVAIDNLGASISDEINTIRGEISDLITSGCEQVKNYKSEMISNLKSSMKNGAESVKNTLNQQIDGIFGTNAVEGSDNTGVASLLSFSYSDYLRLFLMIGLYTNEEGILLRTADVIQTNMAKKTGNTAYRLSNSAVYVEIDATIQVKPTLLALPLFADVEGNPSTNQNWYTFEYKSIKGY